MPPTSVPQSDPSPPMMTASKAKMSRTGPSSGPNVVRMPRKTPPIATVPNAMRGGHRVDVAIVDADEASRVAVVGGGPQRAAELRPAEQQLQGDQDRHRDDERQQRQDTDRELVSDVDAGALDRAAIEALRIGRVDAQQHVLEDHGEAEGDEDRRQ